ncbi:MAG: dTDP-4-dehydrorhamnose reductase [Sediminibacterium sp.]
MVKAAQRIHQIREEIAKQEQYMSKPLIVITGVNGQLGWELQQLSGTFSQAFDFILTHKEELDLSDPVSIADFFKKHQPAYFINCAAYTAVDRAETERERAFAINAEAPGLLAGECNRTGATFIGISTDYVFDGNGTRPYTTDRSCDPVNYYGHTKWKGEVAAMEQCAKTIIIRTSWVYSTHGNNFVKTMLHLMRERPELKVVNDQIGSPTYAADLAAAIMQVIQSLQQGSTHYGIYHFSNEGVISWYDFAMAIRDLAGVKCKVLPIPTSAYPTPAKRPAYSVLDKTSIVTDFGIRLKDWKQSLQTCYRSIVH